MTTFWGLEHVSGSGNEFFSSVTVLADGSYVVSSGYSFVVNNPLPAFPDSETNYIFQQHFDALGNPSPRVVSALSSSSGQIIGLGLVPEITALPDGGWVLAYTRGSSGGTLGDPQLLVQRFDASGTAVGPLVVAVADDSYGFGYHDVVALPDGSVAIAYSVSRGSSSVVDLAMRIISPTGEVGPEIIVDDGPGFQTSASIASDGTNIVVTWTDSANDGDVEIRSFSLSGVATGAAAALSATGDEELHAVVSALAGGGYVAVWENHGENAIRARVLTSSLATRGEFLVSLPGEAPDDVAVVATPNGGFFVAYSTDDGLLYGQEMTSLGTPDGSRILLATSIRGGGNVDLDVFPDGRVVASWTNGAGATASRVLDLSSGSSPIQGTATNDTLLGNDNQNDWMTGFEGADTLLGRGGDDVLEGGDGADVLQGGTGDDLLAGGAGSDQVDGGAGLDTAVFSGLRRDFQVTKAADGALIVTGLGSLASLGADTTTGIERFQFDGAVVSREAFTPSSFNGDLSSDLLLAGTDGRAVVFLQDNNTLLNATTVGPANGSAWRVTGSGDLNGDGHSDIVWQNANGLVAAYQMNGSVIGEAVVVGDASASFRVVGTGDFDGDGQSDIMLQNDAGQAVAWLMDGTTIREATLIGAANGADVSIAAIGDLNGDGKADLVWQTTDGATIGFLMDGTTILGAQQISGATGSGFSVRGIGDIDNDGLGEIIWQFDDGQAGVWRLGGSGLSVVSSELIGAANGAAFQIRDISDLNADGRMDLVWQDLTTGQISGVLLNGATIIGAGLIGGANGPEFLVV